MQSFRKLIGLAGVASNERHAARRAGRFFEWLIFIIAILLPLFWYLDITGKIKAFNLSLALHVLVWFVFVLELVVVASLARRKKSYLKSNWLNLIIVITTFPLFWYHLTIYTVNIVLRMMVILRVFVPWWSQAKKILSRNHLGSTLLVIILVVLVGGFSVSLFDSGIKNPLNGIWWAMETVTTVGYGDVVPTTWAGKLYAMAIMLIGVSLSSILTANFSAYLLGNQNKKKEQHNLDEIYQFLEKLNLRMESIEKKLQTLEMHKTEKRWIKENKAEEEKII